MTGFVIGLPFVIMPQQHFTLDSGQRPESFIQGAQQLRHAGVGIW